MLTDLQKRAAQAIVNIFETGRVLGEYGQVTLLAGDTGHLTYGRAQTTLASGNLALLIRAYCDAADARFGTELRPYVPALEATDTALDDDLALHGLLRRAGDDPVMQREQDAFFDRVYWEPAVRSADYIGAETALGTSIVYDSRIHGSWHALRDRTIGRFGSVADCGESVWFGHYADVRREWLAGHSNSLLHKTVYRMDSFSGLMATGNWGLALPFSVRGRTIDQAALDGSTEPAAGGWAGADGDRLLKLADPYMTGEDVRAVQRALAARGIGVDHDGIFGLDTAAAVREFQERKGLRPDGIVGSATLSVLSP